MPKLHISSAIAATVVFGFAACGGSSGSSVSGAGGANTGSGPGLASTGTSQGGSGGASSGAGSGGAGSGGAGSSAATGSGSGSSSTGGASGASGGASSAIPYPGAGANGQGGLITTGISPESCTASSAFNGTVVTPVGGDNLTCFYSSAVSPTLPLAFIEQDEEVIGSKDLIHVRLTMNPTFVDNTYGTTAIGWSGSDAGTMMGPGMQGHSFWDLIDSDHAEFDFKDASGNIVLSFNLDYCSSDANAPSGFACLGVSGGDGGMLIGSASDIVYYNSSLARDLDACGYGSYTTNSPATDASYDPNPATPDWDYRVVYDVWVSKAALPSGWSVAIPYVHASPSKMASTYTVTAAPCPPLDCVGEGCTKGGECVGTDCDAGFSICTGEGCTDNGQCVGLLCDGGSPTQCLGEGCNSGGTSPEGGTWCSSSGSACTDDSACCSDICGSEGVCF